MAEIQRTPVESTNIASIGYDAESQTLAVEFKRGDQPSGEIYLYKNVSPDEHSALMAADSVGRFFAQNIRSRPFERQSREQSSTV